MFLVMVKENLSLNFMKIANGFLIHKQVEFRNGLVFFRLKKRLMV